VLTRVGSIVEGASAYSHLTGRRNLEVLARTGNQFDPQRIQSLLEQVGLADRADEYVKGYSLGMKQRLGLAAALLCDPDLVILDEPTNGLDPAGIIEVRQFIRRLVDEQGKTVFFSSHILSEVEQVCDRVAIIHKGCIVREGTVSHLLASQSSLRIEASPMDRAEAILREHWDISPNGHTITVSAAHEDVPRVVRKLVENGIEIYQVASQRQTLEEYFLSVTQTQELESVEHA
jgi:ABC-2 type transport system ATP-binding protein